MNKNSLEIFMAYSHKDQEIRNRLDQHLTLLKRKDLINTWYDGLIEPGKEWDFLIKEKLDASDIIILLVSIDFIYSNYSYNVEMLRAIERHEKGEVKVIPILVSYCPWQDSPFAKLQILPRDATPIKSWNDTDEILYKISEEIKQIVQSEIEKRDIKINNYHHEIAILDDRIKELQARIQEEESKFQKLNQRIKFLESNKQREEADEYFFRLKSISEYMEASSRLAAEMKYNTHDENFYYSFILHLHPNSSGEITFDMLRAASERKIYEDAVLMQNLKEALDKTIKDFTKWVEHLSIRQENHINFPPGVNKEK